MAPSPRHPAVARLRRRLSPGLRGVTRTRRALAERHLRGEGLEIGALHEPMPVPAAARVRYVDRHDHAALLAAYPEVDPAAIVAPDVVDDVATLDTVPDGSQDFVIAAHVLEHTEDPLGALLAHARVLRPGGVELLAMPDGRVGVDEHRAATTWEHVLADHREGPQRSRATHFREWAEAVDVAAGRLDPRDLDARAAQLDAEDHSIHFHAWPPEAFLDLLARARTELGLPLTVVEVVPNRHETLIAARRDDA